MESFHFLFSLSYMEHEYLQFDKIFISAHAMQYLDLDVG
jgi:hypothetical protein